MNEVAVTVAGCSIKIIVSVVAETLTSPKSPVVENSDETVPTISPVPVISPETEKDDDTEPAILSNSQREGFRARITRRV